MAMSTSCVPIFHHIYFLLIVITPWFVVDSTYIEYNTSQGIVDSKINVHLVPHSHDDVGWLKTIDQYYVGSNNSIQNACIQNVLDSVVDALLADKNRKFIYVEQAFFQRWWNQQSEAKKKTVKELVKSGQLEFINGGYCMHDEATVHYIDMIDQTTLGHRFIKKEFNQVPRIGWQIDPFGHSAVQAYLLGAQVGFDALYFSRIDYQDRAKRKDTKSLEVIWRGSKNFGSSADIFTGIFPENYEPPPGDFYFEVNDQSPVIQDDPQLFDYNVQQRVDDFVYAAFSQANITRTNHVMFTMGTDFKYQYATSWFRQMDKFIHYVNKDGRVNALYSTPSIYTDAKHAAKVSWPLKTDDFFPYADRENSYWTGYFTSRPALKGYVRMLSAYYLAARQLEFLKGKDSSGPSLESLGEALAIVQHHDAVTGTEKQHVANDYAKRLAIGYTEAAKLVEISFASITKSVIQADPHAPETVIHQCPLLNISYCPPSESVASSGKGLVVLLYNPLGWIRRDVIRVPVLSESVSVHDHKGKEIDSQLLPISNTLIGIRNLYVKAYMGASPKMTPKFWLAFEVTVPPLGFSTYFINAVNQTGSQVSSSKIYSYQVREDELAEIGQGNLKIQFDSVGRKQLKYSNNKTFVESSINHTYSYYTADSGFPTSGAYLFRPYETFPIDPDTKIPLTVMKGPILDEVHQQINPWISQVTRIYKNKEHIEVEYTAGPIPVDDYEGKDLIFQITTGSNTNKTFYTDSNGRDFIKRIRDYRSDWDLEINEPVAGNYYPINLGIYIDDGNKELSVLVDRAVGGSSIKDGQVEVMLHRRLLHDDGKGVDESLNEKVCVGKSCDGLIIAGKYYIRIDKSGEGAKWRRSTGQEIYSPLLIAFSDQDRGSWADNQIKEFSMMDQSYSVPENIAIITIEELEDKSVLVRLAHLYEVGEDKDLSEPAKVDLQKMFARKKIISVKEMSLSANQERAAMERKRLRWNIEDSHDTIANVKGSHIDQSSFEVVIAPMDIVVLVIVFDNTSTTTKVAV